MPSGQLSIPSAHALEQHRYIRHRPLAEIEALINPQVGSEGRDKNLDVDALVESMERFIVEPELIGKMGEASREYAVEKFDVKKVNSLIFQKMGL